MKKFSILLITAIILIFLGCAPQKKMTRDEFKTAKTEYDQSRTRFYKDKSSEDVLDAVARFFELADVDYNISYGENDCIAYRNWTAYFVFGFTMGVDKWFVSTNESQYGTTLRVRSVSGGSTGYMGTPTGGGGAQVTSVPSMVDPDIIDQFEMQSKPYLYYIFFKRMDYLLGLSDEWLTCENAIRAVHDIGGNYAYLDPICVVASDIDPRTGKAASSRRMNKNEANR